MAISAVQDPFAAQQRLVDRLNQSGWDLIVGDAFVRGMRDIGYKSTSYALAELIDNSVQAGATWVNVVFGFNPGSAKPARIAVVDNGWGMVPEMGRASLVWGAGTRPDDRKGFGKYGYGLPSASVSQCLRVEVYTKISAGDWTKSYLDVEEISDGQWTHNHRINTPEYTVAEPPAFVRDHLMEKQQWPMDHGTVVVWDKLDPARLDYRTRDALRHSLIDDLGVIYRRYLVEVPMTVDNEKVEPCDPLFLTPGFRYFDLDEDRAVELPMATIDVPDAVTKTTKGVMRVRFSRMPASFYRNPKYKRTNTSGKGVFNERAAIADAHQGIIFLRNGRQIDVVKPPRHWGAFSNPTTDRYWKIEVDFDATLDDEFSMTTAKQQVVPSESVWDRLKDGAKIVENITSMRATYKKETAKVRGETEKSRERASVKVQDQADKYRTTPSPQDTARRRAEATKNLEDEARRRAQKAGLAEGTVKQDLEAAQDGITRAVETEDMPGAPFYRCVQRGGQRVLLLNAAHPFYTDLYAASHSTPTLRAGLELLLWTLGNAEVDAEPDSPRRKFYESERETLWSPTLKIYLTELRNVDVTDEDEEDDASAA